MSLAWTTEEDTKLHGWAHSTGNVGSRGIVEIKPPDDAAGDGGRSNDGSGQEGGIVCHGVKYAVVTSLPSQYTLRVEVEAKDGSGRWVGDFPKKYLEEITRRTGSFKSFAEFKNVLHAALGKRTEMLTVVLLTYGDLEELKNQRLLENKDTNSSSAGASGSGSGILSSSSIAASQKQNSKRYIILTDVSNGNMVHYPLPLALQTRSTIPTRAIHGGLDDLQSTLERQRKECEKEAEKQSKFCQEKEQQAQRLLEENQRLQQQLEDAQSLTTLEMTKIKADAEDLRTQLDEVEANYDLMRSECAKEIRRLNIQRNEGGRRQQGKETGSPYNKLRTRSSNLELELAEMREKFRKSAARAKYEAEGLKRDIRREAAVSRSLRSQVRQLQRRIRELEAELKEVDEKIQHRNRGDLLSSSRPKTRQHRSQIGLCTRPSPSSRIVPGTASDASPRGGFYRNQSLRRMRKKEWGDYEGRIGSLHSPVRRPHVGISPASRTSSPSSSTRGGRPMFDPTAYQRQREARLKDTALQRKRREIRGIRGGGVTRGCSRDSWIPRDKSMERSFNSSLASPHERGRRKKRYPMTRSKDKDSGYSSAGSRRTGGGSVESSPDRRVDPRQVLVNNSPSQPKSKQVGRSLNKEHHFDYGGALMFEEGSRSTTAAQRKHVKKPVDSALRSSTEEPALTRRGAKSTDSSSKVEELSTAPGERSPKILQGNRDTHSVQNGMLSIDARLNALQDFLKMAKTNGIH